MNVDLRCLCASLALLVALMGVSCLAVPLDLYGPEWQGVGAEGDGAKRAAGGGDEAAGAGAGLDDWKYQAALLERETRGRKNWRASPYRTISRVDNSVKTFSSRFASCTPDQVCKQVEKGAFNCRCPVHTFCVATGKQYDAKCEYSKIGLVYNQPRW